MLYKKSFLDKFIDWATRSSADPTKASMTVKYALLGIVPYIIQITTAACGFGLVCLGVDADGFNAIVDVIADIVFWSFSIISGIGTLIGFVRKVYRSITGRNEVMASWSR